MRLCSAMGSDRASCSHLFTSSLSSACGLWNKSSVYCTCVDVCVGGLDLAVVASWFCACASAACWSIARHILGERGQHRAWCLRWARSTGCAHRVNVPINVVAVDVGRIYKSPLSSMPPFPESGGRVSSSTMPDLGMVPFAGFEASQGRVLEKARCREPELRKGIF